MNKQLTRLGRLTYTYQEDIKDLLGKKYNVSALSEIVQDIDQNLTEAVIRIKIKKG